MKAKQINQAPTVRLVMVRHEYRPFLRSANQAIGMWALSSADHKNSSPWPRLDDDAGTVGAVVRLSPVSFHVLSVCAEGEGVPLEQILDRVFTYLWNEQVIFVPEDGIDDLTLQLPDDYQGLQTLKNPKKITQN